MDAASSARSFKTYSEARSEAEKKARELAQGNEVAAVLSKADALTYRFARNKLAELRADLNCAKAAPDDAISLEDAIVEYCAAKRLLGTKPLAEAIKGFLSTVAQVRRTKVKDAVEEFLKEREAKTRPEKEGARPALSPKTAYQDRLRLTRFAGAFVMEVADLAKEYFDLFFSEHLKGLTGCSRNHYRSTLHLWIKWCVRKNYLPGKHRLHESNGLWSSCSGTRRRPFTGGSIRRASPCRRQHRGARLDGAIRIWNPPRRNSGNS